MIAKTFSVQQSFDLELEVIKELLQASYGEDQQSILRFIRGLESNQNICTLKAMNGNDLIGMIAAWTTSFHPYCIYFAIATRPFQPSNLETELYSSMKKFLGRKLPFQTSVWETSYRYTSFLEAEGFREIRRTYQPTLNLSEYVIPEYEIHLGINLNVNTLKEIVSDNKMKNNLICLVKETYGKVHTANPAASKGIADWENLIFSDDTNMEASFIIHTDTEIMAYAFLHHSAAPGRLEFGWRGTRHQNELSYITYLTALQVKYGKANGYHHIEGEIDSTDPYSLEMLKRFPFTPAAALITYQKKYQTERS
jgi:hypothetical protein